MAPKHTPGPWKQGNDRIECSEGYGVADLFTQRNDAETKANARLIAAAPEMLEALEALVREFDDTYDGDPISMEKHEAIEKARNSIIKARGES